MDDILKRILDKLDKVQDDIGSIKTDVALNTKDLSANTSSLEIHIKGVKQCQTRLDALEKPSNFKVALKEILLWAAWISGVGGAIWIVIKLYKL